MKGYSIRKRLIFAWFLVSVTTLGQKYLPEINVTSARAGSLVSVESVSEPEVQDQEPWLSMEDLVSLFKK